MPLGIPRGAMCVQRFDDSLNSAIHITYRISLRSSSMREPRDPLLKVLTILCFSEGSDKESITRLLHIRPRQVPPYWACLPKQQGNRHQGVWRFGPTRDPKLSNDPSAGSPTEQLGTCPLLPCARPLTHSSFCRSYLQTESIKNWHLYVLIPLEFPQGPDYILSKREKNSCPLPLSL